jgi:hypothetical protein
MILQSSSHSKHGMEMLHTLARSLGIVWLFILCTGAAYGADSYNPSSHQLTIPTIVVGSTTYLNMVVTVGGILGGPSGTTPNGSGDIFNPLDGQLSIPAVTVGNATFYNVVASITSLVSIGSVTAADSYGETVLSIPAVQVVGGSIYNNVTITVGSIVGLAGGMPMVARDEYDPATGELTVPVVQVGSKIYTNATVTVGRIVSIGGVATNTACPARGEEGVLADRSLAFFARGFDGAGHPLAFAGSATPDGTGRIKTAELDFNGLTDGPRHFAPAQLSGSYALGSDGRGCIGLSIAGAAVGVPRSLLLYFSANAAGTGGRIVEFDDSTGTGNVASGMLALQSPAAFSAAPGPSYAFGLGGWDAAADRVALAGSFATGTPSQGAIPITSGFADMDLGFGSTGELSGATGSIAEVSTSDGRAVASITIPNPNGGTYAFDFVVYVVNQSQWFLIGADLPSATTPYLTSGQAIASSSNYGAGPLNGAYMFAMAGYDAFSAGNDSTIGVFQAVSAGTVSNATFFENDSGNYISAAGLTGVYSVDTINASAGRVDISGIANADVIAYLCNPLGSHQIVGFALGTNGSNSLGELVLQTTEVPSYTIASLNGSFTFGSVEDPDNSNANYSGSFQFSGTDAYVFVNDVSITNFADPPYLQPALTGNEPYSINPDGTGTINGPGFATVTNGEQAFAIPTAVDGLLYVLQH